jgi:beta-galactosidase
MKTLDKCRWERWVLVGAMCAGGFAAPVKAGSTFTIGDQDFKLEGQPFIIRGGEMHYPRIPREYWSHRLQMARALGLNTVSTYVFWNVHEPPAGQFDFTGNADVAEFCRLAQRAGLKVIVRPGPYVCGEWDFGGLPWWLLKDSDVRVRTRQPHFLVACRRYLHEVGRQLAPLQVTKGGPIIMVQVENEYDGYGRDRQYPAALRSYLTEAGVDVPFFSSEMTWSLKRATGQDLFRAIGFSSKPEAEFNSLRAVQPSGPLMCSEFYTGWYDSWGRRSSRGDLQAEALGALTWLLEHKASFNLYMVHGGTTFGFRSGANCPPYLPQPTSYDYGAPISEAGWDTPKFHTLRALFTKHLTASEQLPDIPPRNPVMEIPPIELSEMAPLFAHLPKAKSAIRPQCMELFDQPHGCILYRTKLPVGGGERLVITELHDYGLVFVAGKKIATLDRGRKQNSTTLPARDAEVTLDLLVEALGRVNYGEYLHDRKGITEKVELMRGSDVRELTGWEVFNVPLYDGDLARLKFQKGKTDQPAFYRGRFNLREVGDTFLDLRTWGKGVAWVNGHNLGRFWDIGPQQTLYCPGPWLRKGANELIILELNGAQNHAVAGLSEPILDEVNPGATGKVHRKASQALNLTESQPIQSGVFPPGAALQTVTIAAAKGRYLCLEVLSSHSGDQYATCAELDFVGSNGKELARDQWKVVYADSEEVEAEDGSADNVLDSNPGTFWHTQWQAAKPEHPHHLVIDLGREETLTGLRYLPRQDSPNGRIQGFRLFLSATPFPGL